MENFTDNDHDNQVVECQGVKILESIDKNVDKIINFFNSDKIFTWNMLAHVALPAIIGALCGILISIYGFGLIFTHPIHQKHCRVVPYLDLPYHKNSLPFPQPYPHCGWKSHFWHT